MSAQKLPDNPSIKSLKQQAKQLLRAHKTGRAEACRRLVASHPEFVNLTLDQAKTAPVAHADALLVLAREYGYASWPQLLGALDKPQPAPKSTPSAFPPEEGWEWILGDTRPLGSSGGTAGNGFVLDYEDRLESEALRAHVATCGEFITREWRLVALEEDGTRHVLSERSSGACRFDVALLGYRVLYSEIPHGTIRYLGIEAVTNGSAANNSP